MKKSKQLLSNKRGISSLFIGVYIALLIIILISTLFIALSISNSSLTDYLKVEQDRMQESILIAGPGGLTVDGTGKVESLLVNNTGALTARIRALYVAGKLICDPSNLTGDSYIAPQSSIWVDLSNIKPPIVMNNITLNGQWVVTTERGTKSSDSGADLWLGPPFNASDPNRFYFGPLLLFYNWFQWSGDNEKTWNGGWTIPQDADKSNRIIWRILVANIDNRPIILTSSTFTLVQNSQQQQKTATWNLDPALTGTLTLDPKNYYFLCYTGPNNQLNNLLSPNPISSNFLTFIGNFKEANGNLTAVGQTIPFEAVLVTP